MSVTKIVYLGITLILSFSQSNIAQQIPKPCDAEIYHAFDFWLGEWAVTTHQQKTPPSRSSITSANNGCSIHENYSTSGGFTGKSINFYDAKNGKWHQTWIDNQGGALYLNGSLKDNAMVLTDNKNKITWILLKSDQVNQRWETTADKGKSWKVIFDGYYKKIP